MSKIADTIKISPVLKLLIIMSIGIFFGFCIDYILKQVNFSNTINFLNYELNFFTIILNVILLPLIIYFVYKKYHFLHYSFLCLLIGINVYFMNFNTLNTNPKEFLFEPREVYLSGQIERIISQKKNISDSSLTNYTLLVNSQIQSTFLPTHKTNIILKINKAQNLKLNIGDNFNSKAKLNYPKLPQFFGEFNERKFCDNFKANWVAKSNYADFSITQRAIPDFKSKFNQFINQSIDSLYFGKSNAFVRAFILGDQTHLDYQTKEIFSKNGTAHLFSVSGFHIAIFTFLIMVFTTFIINDKFKFAIISIILLLYTYLIGMPEAMIRSVAFILLYFYIKLQFLKVNALNLLSFFVLILLVFFPNLLFNLGMQLSLAAFSGMIIFNPLLADKLSMKDNKNKFWSPILNSFLLTLSASIFISPLIAYYFHFFTISNFLSNLLSMASLSLAVFYSFISIILVEINFYSANLFAGLTSFLIEISYKINEIIYNYDVFLIQNNYVLIISLFASLSSIYLITSKNFNNFLFKLTQTLFVGFVIFNLNPFFTHQSKIIFSRPQNVVYIKKYNNQNNSYNLVLIEQRKFYSYYLRDIELIKNINSLNGKTIILYNGDLGYEIQKDINNLPNKNKQIKFHRLKLNEIEKINNNLKIKTNLYNSI